MATGRVAVCGSQGSVICSGASLSCTVRQLSAGLQAVSSAMLQASHLISTCPGFLIQSLSAAAMTCLFLKHLGLTR